MKVLKGLKLATFFFTNNGDYGTPEDIIIVKTDKWTEAEWWSVRDAHDDERINIVRQLSQKYNNESAE